MGHSSEEEVRKLRFHVGLKLGVTHSWLTKVVKDIDSRYFLMDFESCKSGNCGTKTVTCYQHLCFGMV